MRRVREILRRLAMAAAMLLVTSAGVHAADDQRICFWSPGRTNERSMVARPMFSMSATRSPWSSRSPHTSASPSTTRYQGLETVSPNSGADLREEDVSQPSLDLTYQRKQHLLTAGLS